MHHQMQLVDQKDILKQGTQKWRTMKELRSGVLCHGRVHAGGFKNAHTCPHTSPHPSALLCQPENTPQLAHKGACVVSVDPHIHPFCASWRMLSSQLRRSREWFHLSRACALLNQPGNTAGSEGCMHDSITEPQMHSLQPARGFF